MSLRAKADNYEGYVVAESKKFAPGAVGFPSRVKLLMSTVPLNVSVRSSRFCGPSLRVHKEEAIWTTRILPN